MSAQIRTLQELRQAALDKRAVICRNWHRPQPAGWVLNWPGSVILSAMLSGLFIYNKPTKTEIWKQPRPNPQTQPHSSNLPRNRRRQLLKP